MHNVLRFGLLGLLAGQLALGVGLHGTRAFHALPMLTHGARQQMDQPSRMWEVKSGGSAFSMLNDIAALTVSNIWAVGDSFSAQALIEHWNGTHWSIVPNPIPGTDYAYLTSITALTAQNIWAVGSIHRDHTTGQALIEHWNGRTWSIVPSPSFGAHTSYLTSITALTAQNIWAVGAFEGNGTRKALIEHWNGVHWSIVPHATLGPGTDGSELVSITALTAQNIWAVGSVYTDTSIEQTLIEHWNGVHWSIVADLTHDEGGLVSITVLTTHNIWVLGNVYGKSTTQTRIEHWNGSTWSIVPGPSFGAHSSYLASITALTAHNIWAVGSVYGDHTWQTLIEHWNGSKWSIVPGPASDDSNLASIIAPTAQNIWAVGSSSSSSTGTLIEHWNGMHWSIVSSSDPIEH